MRAPRYTAVAWRCGQIRAPLAQLAFIELRCCDLTIPIASLLVSAALDEGWIDRFSPVGALQPGALATQRTSLEARHARTGEPEDFSGKD